MFDPLQLRPQASLNRTILADLPGAQSELVGRRCWDVLRLAALAELAAAARAAEANTPPAEVPRRLHLALRSRRRSGTDAAARAMDAFGQRLAHLVATLQLEDDDAAALHPGVDNADPWRTAYRRHWRGVDCIWLGGGIAAALGAHLLASVRRHLQGFGMDPARVQLARDADVLALIGAVRSRASPAPSAVAFDFGYTAVKRGVAGFDAHGILDRLELLPPIPVPAGLRDAQPLVMRALATTLNELPERAAASDAEVMVSLASYLTADGRPVHSDNLYGRMSDLDLGQLHQELLGQTGRLWRVCFLHDASAAAAGLSAAGPNDGLIVLGTSLGAGFTSPEHELWPMAPDLTVHRR